MSSHVHIEQTPPAPRARPPRDHITGWGADLDHANRPAYPMERTPPRLQGIPSLVPQLQKVEILRSNERPGLTPVFGTSTPPSGLSGMLRRAAFKFSENDLRHWLILLFADRVNVGDLDGERLATATTGKSPRAVGAHLGHPVATSATK